MRKEKRWRYFCDYCKKSGGSKYYLEKHEKGCTLNPERDCGFCSAAEYQQQDLNELIEILKKQVSINKESPDWKAAIKELREATEGCPVCMLAAIRQSKLFGWEKEQYSEFNLFDFKKEVAAFWAEVNDDQWRKEVLP